MIVCGFAGIGKSTLCTQRPKWIDLESTPFEKDFDRYTKVASHMDKQGYNVMLSCHEGLRKALHDKGIKYVLILPDSSLKNEYIERYKKRGNSEAFIKSLDENWDNYTKVFDWEDAIKLGENEYLSDAIDKMDATNESCYEMIYNVLCDKVDKGEFTIEQAEAVNEAAYKKYLNNL